MKTNCMHLAVKDITKKFVFKNQINVHKFWVDIWRIFVLNLNKIFQIY